MFKIHCAWLKYKCKNVNVKYDVLFHVFIILLITWNRNSGVWHILPEKEQGSSWPPHTNIPSKNNFIYCFPCTHLSASKHALYLAFRQICTHFLSWQWWYSNKLSLWTFMQPRVKQRAFSHSLIETVRWEKTTCKLLCLLMCLKETE